MLDTVQGISSALSHRFISEALIKFCSMPGVYTTQHIISLKSQYCSLSLPQHGTTDWAD